MLRISYPWKNISIYTAVTTSLSLVIVLILKGMETPYNVITKFQSLFAQVLRIH